VYVLNAHGIPNLKGFRLYARGALREIPDSIRGIPGGIAAAPHDVRFTPDGTLLLVSAGGTNRIEVYEVGNDGLLSLHSSHDSSGSGPFGLNFGRHETLLVANATSASVSSYALTASDALEPITPSLADGQMASCWISLSGDRRHAFISNTGNGTLSSNMRSTGMASCTYPRPWRPQWLRALRSTQRCPTMGGSCMWTTRHSDAS
jgi:6-phosphogluconolactonase (cycloisomerase 2 family)